MKNIYQARFGQNMIKSFFLIILIETVFFRSICFAVEPLSTESEEALQKTQDLLRDKKLRQKAIEESTEAKSADSRVNSIAQDEKQRQEIYEASSDIMKDVVTKTSGDPEKMNQLMINAQKNPENFYKDLKKEDQQKIKEISEKIEHSSKP